MAGFGRILPSIVTIALSVPSGLSAGFVRANRPAANVAQDHLHTPAVSGMPQGIPLLCPNPTVASVGAGAWSNRTTWSTGRVPAANDRVTVEAGHTVIYDVASDAAIDCVEVHGRLAFKTDVSTRLKVVTIMVLANGSLEIGTPGEPVAPAVTAEVVIADRPFDTSIDPGQVGHGIVALGSVTLHGAVKTPTFSRVSREPLAGQTSLALEQPVAGWQAGDRIVIPDTRQLRSNQAGRDYQAQTEKLEIASISGTSVRLRTPLAYDHKGARDAAGALEFLPHVGNLTRNISVRSENPAGTRGHTIFLSRAEIDVRYVEFGELGRTRIGSLDNTTFDSEGRVTKIGTNQIGRYAVHFHHAFGATTTPANGYQFTLVGNSIDGSSKWGITVHHSHYGLIQDNVVYNTRGAGVVTEDGSESYNLFDHNFSLRTAGSRDAAPGNGYSSVLPNPGGDGSAFWFRGPNNTIRNNVAAAAAESGFGLPVTALGVVPVPRFKGADTSIAAESAALDTAHAIVPEFANNEAYRSDPDRRRVGVERSDREFRGVARVPSWPRGVSDGKARDRESDCAGGRGGARRRQRESDGCLGRQLRLQGHRCQERERPGCARRRGEPVLLRSGAGFTSRGSADRREQPLPDCDRYQRRHRLQHHARGKSAEEGGRPQLRVRRPVRFERRRS